MKKSSLIILIFVVFISCSVTAQYSDKRNNQNGNTAIARISGSLRDAQTNQIIEYGNVVLYLTKDSSMVNGTISDKEGKFKLENLQFGMYYLKASYIGYATKFIDSIRVNPKSLEVDLG
ncbi:MAG: carboxypeptidase-like regulatory domain-containing protein, partial [Ignavibacteriales bacterium]